jgi:hypothetical protein
MTMSYEPQLVQTNEESFQESSLDLTLMQHLHHETLELRKVRPCIEVEPPRTWYNRISPNSCTLVILLQVDLASSDEPKIVCEGFHETKETFIFTWFSILGVRHYCWLCSPIHQLLFNNTFEGFYETEDTSIFTWFSILDVGDYRWLHNPICQPLPNSKAYYLVRTIRRIQYFLQL